MPVHLLHTLFNNNSRSSLMRSKRVHRSAPALSRSMSTNKIQTSIFPRPSPFNTLPLELQIEIFSLCAPPFAHLSDVNEAPLLLTRVCKSWRTLVSSTPRLWSSFEIELTGSGPRTALASAHDVDTVKDMKRWLQMSKSYPVSARIIHLPVGRSPDLRSAQLVGLLIPEAHRWRVVEFVIPALSMTALQQSLPRNTPSLRSLTLQLNGAASTDTPFDLSKLNIPWHQLTTLNLRLEYDNLITLDKCLDILSQTRALRRCSFDAFCTLDNAADAITLPTLEELHLNLHGKNGTSTSTNRPSVRFTTFLNLLDIPALNVFRVEWLVKEELAWSQAHSQFTSFLGKASQTLQTLSLEYLPLSERELLQCLSCVPNATRLDLRFSLSNVEGDPITDTLLLECIPPSTPPPADSLPDATTAACLIPHIEEVNIECHGKQHTSIGLAAFIESRWASRVARPHPRYATLKSFHLLSMNQPLAAVDKRVKKWCNEGLNISIDSLVVRKRGKKNKKHNEDESQYYQQNVAPEVKPESHGEPSWIVPSGRQDEEINLEAPFGYVDSEVKAYFRTVDVQIRNWQENQEEEADGDVDPNEHKRMFFTAALQEMQGKEKPLSTDPDCSVILERMSYSMDDFVRRVFVDSLAGSYEALVRHRFASHVCQTLFTTKGIMPAIPESNETGELRTLTNLILDICEELLPNFPSLIMDPFASHVVRSLLLLLSPNLSVGEEHPKSAIRSKKSAAWKARQGQMKSVFADDKGKGKETIRNTPSEFRKMAQRFVDAVKEQIGDNETRAMAANKVACPGLQMLLEVEADQNMSNMPGSLMDRVMVGVITACRNNESDSVEESDYLGTLLRDVNSSHLLEIIVSRCPDDAFNVLWKTYFIGKLARLSAHPVANFVLAKALERVSEEQLSEVFEELDDTWSKLIRTARTGVLRAIVDRVCILRALGEKIPNAIYSGFNIEPLEDKQLTLPCILTLLPLPDYRAVVANKPDLAQPDASHNRGHGAQAPSPLEPKIQGSILLQSLLKLPEPHNQFVTDSILALSVEDRIMVSHNASGSRVFDVLLESTTIPTKIKRQFVMDFIGHYHVLVDDKLGSRVVDRCWDFADTYLKEKIARSLVDQEQALAASYYSKYFSRNLNLYLLQRRPDEWRNWQSEKKRAVEQAGKDKQKTGPASASAPTPAPPTAVQAETKEKESKKRKSRPENEIDALFNEKLGKRIKKAALATDSKPHVEPKKQEKGSKVDVKDKDLQNILGAIRVAPANDGKKKKRH
ncbi:hypothetical protein D9619_001195 [Psilocybe cf. subviscida]|uniref:Nucleolar protein 9 n=1 Tax=Psilocybe cf. subviscida TaxID=2480587 RepID=A0A8H5F285_9AGAR|nr:hypothetical protein D9619_001195 [Psilocybe cf. subviscida]